MTASQYGVLRSHPGTAMPPGGGYSIKAEAARKRARAIGLPYLTNDALAGQPLDIIINRLKLIMDRGLVEDETEVAAIMGGERRPGLKISDMPDEFARIESHDALGKSENQKRKWLAPKRRAVANLIEVIGDKELTAITLTNAQARTIQKLIRERWPEQDAREAAYGRLKDRFQVTRYRDIARSDFDAAMGFITSEHPARTVTLTLPITGPENRADLKSERGCIAAAFFYANNHPVSGAVRRLTPVECHRLQGFPDDHCAIPFRGKPAADGPQYKALGNSMAVPVVRWIMERIHASAGESTW